MVSDGVYTHVKISCSGKFLSSFSLKPHGTDHSLILGSASSLPLFPSLSLASLPSPHSLSTQAIIIETVLHTIVHLVLSLIPLPPNEILSSFPSSLTSPTASHQLCVQTL